MKYKLLSNKYDSKKGIVYNILKYRGIEDPIHYLHTTEDDINDPQLLDNIREGVMMLVNNIEKNSPAMMLVDSDSDGINSAALLLNYLHLNFPGYVENSIELKFHTGKQHGLSDIEIPANIRFIIVPDAASNDDEYHRQLAYRGIDVLILDHHELESEPINDSHICIINNKIGDYPNKDLSGGGIVYKFCEYINWLLLGNDEAVRRFRDIAAVACIGDMVALTNYETKRIIDTGLKNINNPFLKGIIEKNSFMIKGELSPTDIAFSVVPYLNAICRSGTQEEKELVFNAMLEYRCNTLIPSTKRGHKDGDMETILEQSLRTCANVKNRQNREKEKLSSMIKSKIKTEHIGELEQAIIVPLEEKEGNMNLNGLIANELVAEYQKPVMILIHNNGTYTGSMRGVNGSDLEDLRQVCEDTGEVIFATGHAQAAGLSVAEDNLENFKEALNYQLKDYTFDQFYKVDFVYSAKYIPILDILEIAELKSHYGQGVPESLVAIEGLKVSLDKIKLMSPDKKPTLKFIGNGIDFIKFKSSEEEFEKLVDLIGEGYIKINLVGTCNKNEWNGNVTPQIIVKEYEVIEVMPYDF